MKPTRTQSMLRAVMQVLAIAILTAPLWARAQLVGDLARDGAYLEEPYASAWTAIGPGSAEEARSAMEAAVPAMAHVPAISHRVASAEPLLASDIERLEAQLAAAANFLDAGSLGEANDALASGHVILREIASRAGGD